MNRTEWLESLKPDDEVYVERHLQQNTIEIIEKITQTGRVKLFGITGHFIDGRRNINSFVGEYIVEPTDKIKHEIKLKMKAIKIKEYKWRLKEEDKINAVYDILFGDKNETTNLNNNG